jgi:putative ABC transport system permease protein
MSRLLLAWRQLRADAGPLATLALVLFATTALAAGLPRWLAEVDDRAVVSAVADSVPGDVLGTKTRSENLAGVDVIAGLQHDTATIQNSFDPALTRVLGSPVATLQTPDMRVAAIDGVPEPFGAPRKTLIGEIVVTENEVIRFTDGAAPTAGSTVAGPFAYFGEQYDSPDVELAQTEVGLSTECAHYLGLTVGQTVAVRSQSQPLLLQVSGIFEPIDPGAYVWKRNRGLVTPTLETGPAGITGVTCNMWLTGDSLATLASAFNAVPPGGLQPPFPSTFARQWQLPVIADRIHSSDVGALMRALDRAETSRVATPPDFVKISTSVQNPLRTFLAQQTASHAVIAVGTAGALLIAVTVLALAAVLVVSRRRTALVLARARGASVGQILGVVALEGLIAAGAAGAAGWWLATKLIASRAPSNLGPRLVIGLVAAAVIALVATTWWTVRHGASGQRENVGATQRSPRRAAVEIALVLLAVAGVVLLRQRGFSASVVGAQVDPLLVAAPILVAAAVAVLALRAYPWPLRLLGRAAASRPGAVGFLGLARAARTGAASVAPLLALLVATSFAVFGSVVQHSVSTEQSLVAWAQVGAHLRVDGTDFNPETDVPRIAEAAGVPTSEVLGVRRMQSALVDNVGATGQRFDLLLLDPQAYADFVKGTPVDATAEIALADAPPTVESVVPAIVSPAMQRKLADSSQTGQFLLPGARAEMDPVAVTDEFPSMPPTGLWAIARTTDADVVADLPYWPTMLFIDAPNADADAVTAAVQETQPFSVVRSRAAVYADLADAPLIAATSEAFAGTAIVAAAFCVLTVILGLVVTAATRARFLAYVRTVGVGRRQARSLVAMEVVPLATLAVAVGLVLGVVVPGLLLPSIDLRPFTGGTALPPVRVPPLPVLGLGAGLLLVVAIAVFGVAAVDRRRGLGGMLRLGEDR